MRAILAAMTLVLGSACGSTVPAPPDWIPEGFHLVYAQDFADASSLEAFDFSDPSAWRWAPDKRGGTLELLGGSEYQPPVRSPTSLAILKKPVVGDFVLRVDLLQTGREYGHRDLCLFFGYTGPSSYYYVHLAPAPDERAHNVFIVNDADRARIGPIPTSGFGWRDVWHTVRLERIGDSIRVFADDDPEPVLEASDATFPSGRIGFGSFDDQGKFARVRIVTRM